MTDEVITLSLSRKGAELLVEALSDSHGRWMSECERALELGDRDSEAAFSEKAIEAWQLVTEIRELLAGQTERAQ
jgi:hypothetical protein